ncbi:hypothetical protein DNU06_15525 [Putridiphycobacter roseus]|uniref:Uncharacterized protein n=1 Tax=Putridiphycobacter roseus TaxID=2219161 RepID=A0A2W1MVR5_9FLAO|nr:hypothetical protein [Putridiphycobacter roseus]PZE15917.1 hypothetical protein DNU06_15525 [Putridiphycobacter roseus]
MFLAKKERKSKHRKTNRILFHFITLLLLISCNTIKIKENERGVLFKRFDGGIDTSKVYLPGKHSTTKWNYFKIYNISSKSGSVDLVENEQKFKIEYTYKPIPEKVNLLEYYIGADYQKYVLEPEIKNMFLELIKKISINEIEVVLLQNLKPILNKKYIDLQSVNLLEIKE